jgi:hypothetical protein
MNPPALNPLSLRLLALMGAVLAIAGCHPAPDQATFTAAMNTYLAQRGDLCLGKSAWPIDVTQHEIDVGGRNARQMPPLERLGLVSSSVAEVVVDDEGTKHAMKVRRFELTEAGKRYLVQRDAKTRDFCAAHLALDRVVGWKLDRGERGPDTHALVTYTYRIDAAPWTGDSEIQQVFPVVAGMVRGAGTTQLEENFVRTERGWVAVDLLGT